MRCYLSLLIALLLAGCENPKPVIKLSVVLHMRGKLHAFRLYRENGARLAVNECNKVNSAIVGVEFFDSAMTFQRITASLADMLMPFFSRMSSDVVKGFVANYQPLNGMNSIPAYSSQSHHIIFYRLKYALAPAGLSQ